MDNHTISISVKNTRLLVLESFFIDHFSLHRSPVYPIFISFNFHLGKSVDGKTPLFLRDSCVSVASKTPQVESQSIAKIVVQEYPTYSIAFFEIVGGNPENFTRVDRLARCVIKLLKKLDYEILSTDPQELMIPSIPQLEGIDASPRDLGILRMYLVDKKTAKEIGDEVCLAPLTINNIISRYRSIYGEERIPKRQWESVSKSKKKVI